ncbi:MAG: 2-oxoisovalerate dehydrogenase [bacterium]|nr:2-oxoisovalerate dehydrogenase [bacterium]
MKLKEIIFVVEEDPEGGYNAKALGYSIFTEGETLEELKENIKDAIRCYFDSAEDMPDIIRLHIVKEETFTYA